MQGSKISRKRAQELAIHRKPYSVGMPKNDKGDLLRVSEYFGCNVFDVQLAKNIPSKIKSELEAIAASGKTLPKEYADIVAKALTKWAIYSGATHFCHWFQPLTGSTAEKHDAFLDYDHNMPIEKFSASQLTQGEPDASSFPHGGSRSTFEARGYTAWDITSPIFIREEGNGKTLCIPTAFVSYHSDALDIKTPLLRSISRLNDQVTKFLHLAGKNEVSKVRATCGAEQEYFLIDKSFYYLRPDLVMTGRTLLGSQSARNQQLEDHYFGTIPSRVIAFMQDLETQLYKMGIPAKTRHNEVAPGQFELAPIFLDANIATDHNQLVMVLMEDVAQRHDFVVLLHEKPFQDINGSGKHLNWSMSDNFGDNLLDPGNKPEENHRFLTLVSIVCEAVYRHADCLRMAISGAGNDHRLGGNEAPPSIISIFLGDTLSKIFTAICNGESYSNNLNNRLDLGADQLANLLKDNTDRNRTSPFAFTGNKFEFRAVGSSQNIGLPLSILNAAVTEVVTESNEIFTRELKQGKSINQALTTITVKWLKNSFAKIVFNGDGYSGDWVKEASERGLPNLGTSVDALNVLRDENATSFLVKQNIYRTSELKTRYNILMERYNKHRAIEFVTLTHMVDQHVIPAAIEYKKSLLQVIESSRSLEIESLAEISILEQINSLLESLHAETNKLKKDKESTYKWDDENKIAQVVSLQLLPQSEKIGIICNGIENLVPDNLWGLPTYLDMLFIR